MLCLFGLNADLVAPGHMLRHVLQAAHHPLIPEVVRKRLCPLSQQLDQFGCHLTEAYLRSNQCCCHGCDSGTDSEREREKQHLWVFE